MIASLRPLSALAAALLCLMLVVTLGFATALPAMAKGEEAQGTPAVERLKPDELEFLKKKFPEWDKVDARRKEHIARNVIRLRDMGPEERKKLKSRVDRLRRGHKGHGKGRHFGSTMFRVADEVGARVVARFPETVRAELAKLDVRPSMVRMTVFRMLKGKVAEGTQVELSEAELARLSERVRKRVQGMLAAAEGDPKKRAAVRARIQRMLAWGRMSALLKRLKEEAGGKDVAPAALADALIKEWSAPFEDLVAEISADPKSLLAAVQRTERDYMSKTDYGKSIWALERLAQGKWRRDPAAQAAADRVVKRLLIDELRVDARVAEALPGYDSPRERRSALSKLVPGSKDGARSRGGRRGGKGGKPEGRRGARGSDSEAPRKGKRSR